ncbi:MAG: hypothetical protein WCA39_03975, partial [Nitrososphaeraceae archaeon]
KYTLLFLPSDASFIGSNSRTQHECTSQNYSLFFVPNVWVLPNKNVEQTLEKVNGLLQDF